MITILYEYNQNGPGKVIKNLKLGLEKLNIPYKENPKIVEPTDKVIALQWHPLVESVNPDNLLIGPNVCTLPVDNQFIMSQKYKKVIVPSGWVKGKYKRWIPEEKILVWPVGVDTDCFGDKSNADKHFDCLVYYKRRSSDDLEYVKNMLKKYNQNFGIIEYGNYTESQLIDGVSNSKYVFLLDSSESQGIAVQEIMSMNVPLFVWDITHWSDRGDEFKVQSSSVPYWDERCGMCETLKENLEKSFNFFLEKFAFFAPRDYILENLTLEKQAKQIIKEL